jgi:hypothetical protein
LDLLVASRLVMGASSRPQASGSMLVLDLRSGHRWAAAGW